MDITMASSFMPQRLLLLICVLAALVLTRATMSIFLPSF